MAHRPLLVLAALLAGLVLPATGQAAKKSLYLSIGDSYAVGYQPDPTDGSAGGSSRDGFADQVVGLAKARGQRLTLRNFGCGGATTSSVLERKGCPERARAVRANRVTYSGTQAAAAVDFLKRNRRRTGLITVSIGGNDVTKCVKATDIPACVTAAVVGINTNLKTLLARLRKAAGPKVRIVGITYPDVILGEYVKGTEAGRALANASQAVFKSIINPALKKQYEAVGGRFVDVTKATLGYDPLDGETTQVPGFAPYDILPLPVARICELTWYCQFGDIHSKRSGYRVIAKLIAGTLPRRK